MFLPLKDRRAYYDLAGPENGPVVVFGHSLAADSGMWAEQLQPLFEAGFRALRIDMRGHGGSDTVPGDYTMQQLGDDVITVTDALDIKRFHFIGLSIGGMYGQWLGIKHGAKVQSLILCDTNPGAAPNAKEMWAPRVEAAKRANSLAPIAEETMKRWFSDGFREKHANRWKQLYDTVAATDPKGYEGCVAAIVGFNWRPQLPQVKTPTLCVCGTLDPGGGPTTTKPIAELIPGARYEEIKDALHLPNVERPDVFNKLMLDWLKSKR
jgi:3-oxoadipate enol-lactonase